MENLIALSDGMALRAYAVLKESGIKELWEQNGATVNVIGSVAMGLIINHRDIDLHVYSSGITEESSFGIAAQLSKNPRITEITCINGLHTDERCIAWHLKYKAENGEDWKFDIIHIEKGTQYDGFFEEMAARIKRLLTEEKRHIILDLKFHTPEEKQISGVLYYEAVISDGVKTMEEFNDWLEVKKANPSAEYWMP